MRDGHFDYGNGFHGRVYLNPHQLFRTRRRSGGWRRISSTSSRRRLLEQTEIVAGPATGGALLAHTIAGLLDGRRALTHPACSFAPFTPRRRQVHAAQLLRPVDARASACCSPTTCATPGKTFERCAELVDEPAAPCSRRSRSAIAWRRSSTCGVPELSRSSSIARPRTIPAAECPMCAAGEPITTFLGATCGSSAKPSLQPALDSLYRDYNREESASDPVHRVRPFDDPARSRRSPASAPRRWRSAASRACSTRSTRCSRSWGRVRPSSSARSIRRRSTRELRAMVHRWTRGDDIAALLWILRQMLEQIGLDRSVLPRRDDAGAPDVGPALDSFSTRALALDIRRAYGRVPKRPGVCYFFPRPSAGSACKRLNLFLRWMVRRDEVDLGVWTRVSPARLIVPLDTHVIRLGRCLRLTRYVSPGWKMAADITASLRQLDPDDPVRFDFSICHVGMMNACGFGRKQGDSQCPLKGLCHPRLRRARPSADRRARCSASPLGAAIALLVTARATDATRRRTTVTIAVAGRVTRGVAAAKRPVRQACAKSCGSATSEAASVTIASLGSRSCDEIVWTPDGKRVGFVIDGRSCRSTTRSRQARGHCPPADQRSRADAPRPRHHVLGERPRRDIRRLPRAHSGCRAGVVGVPQ